VAEEADRILRRVSFDVATTQKRLAELDTLMGGRKFSGTIASKGPQKLIDESNSLRKKVEPLLKADKQLEDLSRE